MAKGNILMRLAQDDTEPSGVKDLTGNSTWLVANKKITKQTNHNNELKAMGFESKSKADIYTTSSSVNACLRQKYTEFTIAFWAYCEQQVSEYGNVLYSSNNYPPNPSSTNRSSNNLNIRLSNTSFGIWTDDYQTMQTYSVKTSNNKVWRYYELGFKNQQMYYFVDGKLIEVKNIPSAILSYFCPILNYAYMGDWHYNYGSNNWNGRLYDFMIVDKLIHTTDYKVSSDMFRFDVIGLLKGNEPINLLDKTSVKGFTCEGIEPANTNRRVAFKVDDVWNKINTSGALVPLETQEITSDSVLAEGNTVSELEALTNVSGMAGKLIYPAVALYASEDAEVMPTFGMTVKAEIDTTVNVYSYTAYSQEYAISDGDDVPIVSVVAETETKGNGAVDITARIKQDGEWSDYMTLNAVQMKNASAIQLKAVYTVQNTNGTDAAKINGVIIKYNTSGAITSNSTTDIVTVTEKFTNDLKYVSAFVKHKELNDAKIKVYCSLRKTPSKRIMYQFGNGTGALKTFTLPNAGINQDTLLVYVDGKLVYDYGYNTETSEITITADKDAVLSASYEYGWSKSEWIEMEQGVSQINDSGAYTTEYSYTVPEHEGELTVTAIKYELLRPNGRVNNEIIGVGTGKRQIIQLPHYARKETIQCNGKWSYDYDSKRLTIIAPEGENIVISYDWIAESPQIYGVMAGWAD